MTTPTVSVVIVSRGRAADLPRCLLGVSQLDYPAFEVVLVVDPIGHAAVHRTELYDDLKIVPFDEANISAARNLGIAEAAGEIVAFIDDDAVPEPTWLSYLVAGFSDPDVACAGGYVRGRNGISFQWKARTVDDTGKSWPLDIVGEATSVLTAREGRAIKTEGTNMAVRRDVLADLGGFDPAYRFFLDETDLNKRIAQRGFKTAIAPLAQVHHGYKANSIRRSDRAPQDYFELGASQVVFLRKFSSQHQMQQELKKFSKEQNDRAVRHLIAGGLEPKDVRFLKKRLALGIVEGHQRSLTSLPKLGHARAGFKAMPARYTGHEFVSARVWNRRKLLDRAKAQVASGRRISAFVFSPTLRPHKVTFTKDGVWLQSGGLFGRSVRFGPRLQIISFRGRIAREKRRVEKLRALFQK